VTAQNPAEVLRESRRRDSRQKRQRVRTTVDDMLSSGDPVTFAAVARAAKVSTWLVYAEGVREHVEAAIKRQTAQPVTDRKAGLTPSMASLQTDLELARAQIKELRSERDKLRDHIRIQLGQQLEQISSKTLIERVDELTQHNRQLADHAAQSDAENERLRDRVTELEEDLAAARTSLRRVIKAGNIRGDEDAGQTDNRTAGLVKQWTDGHADGRRKPDSARARTASSQDRFNRMGSTHPGQDAH
jgi:chromosome segregation ATPase